MVVNPLVYGGPTMRYIFGEWILGTQHAELCGAGGVRRLRRKAFQLLTYLLAHADRVVSKHELYEQVWPQQFISETTLESTIVRPRWRVRSKPYGRPWGIVGAANGSSRRCIARVIASWRRSRPTLRPL
jgi:hypothetical protein